jgi:hypothetical protein
MTIKKTKSGYKVTNKAGTKTLGTHKSKAAAARQLAAIEISKKKRGK